MSERGERTLVPEVAALALTIAAALSLDRLFSGYDHLPPVLLAAVASHAVAYACRRRGLGTPTAALASAGVLAVFVALVVEPQATSYGLPLGELWNTVSDDLSQAWRQFGEVVAPVPPERGFVLAACIGVWASAFVADWAAFRVGAAFESLVPAFTLFTFSAALGTARERAFTTAVFVAAILGFLLVHGATMRSSRTAWFASRVRGGPLAIVRSGASIAVIALAASLVVGPALPGATDPAVLDWRDDDDNGSRVTVSPLVDIRGRLVSQSDVEVFTVRSDVRAYWRLTSLDTFDGSVWGSRGSYRDAGGDLARDVRIDAEQTQGVQEFSITALDTPWLPAAYRPERYRGPDGVAFDPDSGSLLAEAETSIGLVYAVRSTLPRHTVAQLRGSPGETPDEIVQRYTALPPAFPPVVRAIAARVATGSTTYDRALALQNWFRSEFTYSLDVNPGHGDAAILQFLRDRRGYCEQFAGTFAAMARSLGIPARVAVGFTPGELLDGLYHVTGKQAHAWPEVFIDGAGWVAFEPTPGRGAPGAQQYTGVPEQQQTERGPEIVPEPAQEAPGTTAPPTAGSTPDRLPPGEDDLLSGAFDDEERPSRWPGRLLVVALALAAVAVIWMIVVPSVRLVQRRRRRAGARTPSERALVAWDEAAEALATVGATRHPEDTHAEFAARAMSVHVVDPAVLDGLATTASRAAFAPSGVDEAAAEAAVAASATVQDAVRDRAGTLVRVRRALDPRTLR